METVNITKKKKCWLVQGYDDAGCIAVIATSRKEAKKIGYGYFSHLCDWIDIRLRIVDRDIKDLPIGIVKDNMDALKRGIYSSVFGECPVCTAKNCYLTFEGGKIQCEECVG